MKVRTGSWAICLVSFLVFLDNCQCEKHCLRCLGTDFTLLGTDCECDSGLLYDEESKSCVEYFDCPLPGIPAELRSLGPLFEKILESNLRTIRPVKPKVPEDVKMAIEVTKKRLNAITNKLPALFGPIITPILLQHKEILEDCQGKSNCIVLEALRKGTNMDKLYPKMKPVVYNITKDFLKVFEDLAQVSDEKKCDYLGNCSVIKGVSDLRQHTPSFDEVLDYNAVVGRFTKFFIGSLTEKDE